jgi:hypothetical protein
VRCTQPRSGSSAMSSFSAPAKMPPQNATGSCLCVVFGECGGKGAGQLSTSAGGGGRASGERRLQSCTHLDGGAQHGVLNRVGQAAERPAERGGGDGAARRLPTAADAGDAGDAAAGAQATRRLLVSERALRLRAGEEGWASAQRRRHSLRRDGSSARWLRALAARRPPAVAKAYLRRCGRSERHPALSRAARAGLKRGGCFFCRVRARALNKQEGRRVNQKAGLLAPVCDRRGGARRLGSSSSSRLPGSPPPAVPSTLSLSLPLSPTRLPPHHTRSSQ